MLLPNLACCQVDERDNNVDAIDASTERYPGEDARKLPTYGDVVAAADGLVDDLAVRVAAGTAAARSFAAHAVKAAGSDLDEVATPAGEPVRAEFRFFAQKPERYTPLGVEVDDTDGRYVFIARVKDEEVDSVFPRYNARAGYKEMLQAGDYIVEVNGISGDSRKMAEELSVERELTLLVRRSTEVRVNVRKTGSLGLEFSKQKAACLLVKDILPGPIQDWNDRNPGKEVKLLDRLLSVNGTAPGDGEKLFGLLWETDLLEMLFVRPADGDTKVRPGRSTLGRAPSSAMQGRAAEAEEPNEWLDQYFAKYLRQRPKIFHRHQIAQLRSCVYLVDGHEVRLEWQPASRPGGEGFLVGAIGEERMPLVDFFDALKTQTSR